MSGLSMADVRTNLTCQTLLPVFLVAAKERKLSYHNSETISFTVFPCYVNLKANSWTAAQFCAAI